MENEAEVSSTPASAGTRGVLKYVEEKLRGDNEDIHNKGIHLKAD